MGRYYIGVDVGTASVRAALVNSDGDILATASQPIQIWEPKPGYYEQSSEDVWAMCCKTVKAVTSKVNKEEIKGIGFDSTCSLVVLGKDGQPVTASPSGDANRNIVMWMDHRASHQADRINATKHRVLDYVGGIISPEMETPKLMWLKENLKMECWDKAEYFMELPDFLTWKATGSLSRSLCSVVCKWTYVLQPERPGEGSWSNDYFKQIGLEDLTEDNYRKIGNDFRMPGYQCGEGLSEHAAEDLGLRATLAVGTGIIDAHAGGIGVIGCQTEVTRHIPLGSRIAVISGTSACHMKMNKDPVFVPGVWGPFYNVMVPEFWTNEAGQTACGKLIDHIVETHPAYSEALQRAEKEGIHLSVYLNQLIQSMAEKQGLSHSAELTRDLHMWPDFHGNRSPLADSTLKGMISGLTLACGVEELACNHLATIQALAYGTKHILEALKAAGHQVEMMFMCGGLAKNSVYVQTHADVTGIPIMLPDQTESVLLGSAILGALASGDFNSIQDAMAKMCGAGKIVYPQEQCQDFHKRKYQVFLKMLEHQREYNKIMTH
ncbi:FGGY carbohydrate kinase domain-containing protein [Lingula anatina]|uniref:FGGY carbohydrate kinase domain-containing protein n=1 Tax=Lingula anatina TaxID=7574 RepID=A0A1S3K6Z7_LINAN|nr:FGGY carbohydrate kinase domain-containing protein [Lingula anatina]|eukprot:XP_013418272.1 FGGY carbohydrate kinase domain-containing protein [Lingula anatina]